MSARRSPELAIASALWRLEDGLLAAGYFLGDGIVAAGRRVGSVGHALIDGRAACEERIWTTRRRLRSTLVIWRLIAGGFERLAAGGLGLVIAGLKAHRRVWRPRA